MIGIPIPCQCCGRQFIPEWNWFICDKCNYRICTECLPKHKGPYATGGYKCSQCVVGYLKGPKKAF